LKEGDIFMDASFSAPRNNQDTRGPSMTSVLDQGIEKDTSPLRWWYRLTAPAPVPADASLQERELVRRGRLTSATLLVVIFLLLAAEPVGLLGPNKGLVVILCIPLTIDIIALVFNKLGKIVTAGILVLVGIEVGVALATIGPALGAGGLSTYILPQYDLLAQAEFVAVTLLPPSTVFLMAGLHTAFIFLSIIFLPHSHEFDAILATNQYEIFLRPLSVQVIVALVTYMWVTSAYQAVKRADRAEVIADLERRELERQQEEIALKQQLDEGIQQIMQTHVQVANGDFAARAPLKQDNILWRIAYSLNNLLARLQSLSRAEQELQQAKAETNRLVEAIHQAKAGHPIKLNRTGTYLDSLILELMSTPSLPNPNMRTQSTSHPTINNRPAPVQDNRLPQPQDKKVTKDFRLKGF
jgi:hypothetical protein